MMVKYFIPDYGQDASDPYAFEYKGIVDEQNSKWIAEEAADHFFSNHDGWDSDWPLDITIIIHGKEITFGVEMESKPVFYAAEKENVPIKSEV